MKEIEQQQRLAQQAVETLFEQEPEWKKAMVTQTSTSKEVRITSQTPLALKVTSAFFVLSIGLLLLYGFIHHGATSGSIPWEEIPTVERMLMAFCAVNFVSLFTETECRGKPDKP